MNDDVEQIDAMLRTILVPSLAPGAHQQELKQALMQEARGRRQRPVLRIWGVRFAYAAGIVLALGMGACWAHKHNFFFVYSQLKPVLTTQPTTRDSFGQQTVVGSGMIISGENLTEPQAKSQADMINTAIADGKFTLERSEKGSDGIVRYTYRLKLADGTSTLMGFDHALSKDPVQRKKLDEEFEQAMGQGKGDVIRQKVDEQGLPQYTYQVKLSDGSVRTYGSNLEPDPRKRAEHDRELAEAAKAGRGEVYSTIKAPDGSTVYMIKVRLSDGTVRTYGSSTKPTSK